MCDITQRVSNCYTVKGQFFAFNLEKITLGRKNLHSHRLWCLWQIWGVGIWLEVIKTLTTCVSDLCFWLPVCDFLCFWFVFLTTCVSAILPRLSSFLRAMVVLTWGFLLGGISEINGGFHDFNCDNVHINYHKQTITNKQKLENILWINSPNGPACVGRLGSK